jgi:hypothetical protein
MPHNDALSHHTTIGNVMSVIISIILLIGLAMFAEYRRNRLGIVWFFGTAIVAYVFGIFFSLAGVPYGHLLVPLTAWMIVAIAPAKPTKVQAFVSNLPPPRHEPRF